MSKLTTVELPVRMYDETLRLINKIRRGKDCRPLKRIPTGVAGRVSNNPIAVAIEQSTSSIDLNKHTEAALERINALPAGTEVSVCRGVYETGQAAA